MRLPLLLTLAVASILPAAAAAKPADTPDLKIVTRFISGRRPESTTTQYIKGNRSRIERDVLGHPRVTINQCDLRQVLQLDPEARQYTSYQLNEQGRTAVSQLSKPNLSAARQPEPSGGTLVVNFATTDTGERKKRFGFDVRHVIETQTMVPGPGAISNAQEIVRDGWYIDLDVNPGCAPQRNGRTALLLGGVARGGPASPITMDKLEVHRAGAPEAGFAVALTTKTTDHGREGESYVSESEQEVVELDTAPLDTALFEIPKDFEKVNRLQDHIDAAASPAAKPPQSAWETVKRYWASLFR
jgi:hypothetical protein